MAVVVKPKKKLPDIYNNDIQEKLCNTYIDLFSGDTIPIAYFSENKENIKNLYLVFKYLQMHYPNNIDKYCEYILELFFDETYTADKYLKDRINFLTKLTVYD